MRGGSIIKWGLPVALVILAGLLMVIRPWKTGLSGQDFLLDEGGGVDRIMIHDDRDTILLVNQGKQWLLDGRDEVAEVAVENLLYAASHLEVVSVLSALPEGAGKETRELVFLKGERVELAYVLCRAGDRFLLQPENSDQWFGVALPGFAELDLGEVFSSEKSHYLEHMLIQLPPTEISWIEVKRSGEDAFRIRMDDEGNFACLLPGADSLVPEGVLDELSQRLLFSYFTAIRFECRATEYPGQLPGRGPDHFMAALEINAANGETHQLEIYSLPAEGNGDDPLFKACVYHNHDPEAFIINYIYLDVLMRPLEHYFAK